MQGSVRKRGNYWYYRYYAFVDGRKKQIERKGGSTKHQALIKLRHTLCDLDAVKNHMIDNREVLNNARKC